MRYWCSIRRHWGVLFRSRPRRSLGPSIRHIDTRTPKRIPFGTNNYGPVVVHDFPQTAPLAERQLAHLLQSGYLEQPIHRTEHTRRHAREPNRNVEFGDAMPWRTVATHLQDNSDGVDSARECMKAFKKRLATLTVRDALSEIQDVGLGQKCLRWMLESSQRVWEECGWDLEFIRLLAHFMIAENLEPTLWQGLEEELSKRPATDNARLRKQNADIYAWCGRLHHQIVELHFMRGVSGSADEAIRSFLALSDLKTMVPAARAISYGGGKTALTRSLRIGSHPHTDPRLFDSLLDRLQKFYGDESMNPEQLMWARRYTRCMLLVAHPTKPDPGPVLELWRATEAGENDRFLHPKTPAEAWAYFCAVRDVASLLRSQGRSDDADWTDNFVKKFLEVHSRLLARERKRRSQRDKDRSSPLTIEGEESAEKDSDSKLLMKNF